MVEDDDLHKVRRTLFNVKPYEALLSLQNQRLYVAEISTAIDSTRSHTTKMMKEFEEYGLVNSEKKGRKMYYCLTEKGSELVEELHSLESFLVPDSSFNTTGPSSGGSLQQCSVSRS